jgi:hypothetical protein
MLELQVDPKQLKQCLTSVWERVQCLAERDESNPFLIAVHFNSTSDDVLQNKWSTNSFALYPRVSISCSTKPGALHLSATFDLSEENEHALKSSPLIVNISTH